jgi:hypothetical protein
MSGRGLRVQKLTDLPMSDWQKRRLNADKKVPVPATGKRSTPRPAINYEDRLFDDIKAAGLPTPSRQFFWHPDRGLRSDLAYPDLKHPLLIEVEGAAHRIKQRFHDDILRNQEAVIQGFTMLRIATDQVMSGDAVWVISQALERLKTK